VTIAVDSFGPVTDNAQSVYELSQIERRPGIAAEIEQHYGFKPDFEHAKLLLEKSDGAGNTFKATAKPVLIGTAVVGSTTMVFGIILLLDRAFWRRGRQAQPRATPGPAGPAHGRFGHLLVHRRVDAGRRHRRLPRGGLHQRHMRLDATTASTRDSKEIVRICTQYAQRGMINIFVVIFCFALALPFFDPYFFIGYLVGLAFFGLFQAIFMANAGGAWDNAKKIVETDLRQKNTPLHAATVVGDTSAIRSRTRPPFRSIPSSNSPRSLVCSPWKSR